MTQKLIVKHREISAQIASLQIELKKIESSAEYAKELKWAEDLQTLMLSHGKNADDVVNLLGTDVQHIKRNISRGPKAGTPRKRITYKNPHTGEEIKTASGNNRILKEWKKNYPNDNIQTWII